MITGWMWISLLFFVVLNVFVIAHWVMQVKSWACFRSVSKVMWYTADIVRVYKDALFADGAISARHRRIAVLYGNYQRGWNASSTNQNAWPEAPRCKIINLDHQSSLQHITTLPEPIKCNMHAIIKLKYPTETKRVTRHRKGQDLAAFPLWPGTSHCHARPWIRSLGKYLNFFEQSPWFHKKQARMRFMASAKAAAIETQRAHSVPAWPSRAFVLLNSFHKTWAGTQNDSQGFCCRVC